MRPPLMSLPDAQQQPSPPWRPRVLTPGVAARPFASGRSAGARRGGLRSLGAGCARPRWAAFAWAGLVVLSAAGCSWHAVAWHPRHAWLHVPADEPWPDAAHSEPPVHEGEAPPAEGPGTRALRERIARGAGRAVGQSRLSLRGQPARMDCSGVVRAIYAEAEVVLGGTPAWVGENDVSVLFRWVGRHGSLRRSEPRIGDLVFFDHTYDRNRNGQVDDPLSHVGIVESMLPDGTLIFVHHVERGILRYRMNLQRPEVRVDPATGARLNHELRRGVRGQPGQTTASLFRAFGTPPLNDVPDS